MAGIIDIAPIAETADIRGHAVIIRGVELTELAAIIARFPEVRNLFDGKAIKADAIGALSKIVQAAVIAAGVDEIDEVGAGNLTPGERALLMSKILLLTLPDPIGPFVDALKRMLPAGNGRSKTS